VIVVRTQRKAIDASLAFDNRNSRYLGRQELVARTVFNAIDANGDRLGLSGKVATPSPDRSWYVGADYLAPIGNNGMAFTLSGYFARSEPGLDLEPLEVESKVVSVTGSLTYPIIRSRRQNLRAFGEFEYRNVRTDLADTPFNRDHLRIMRAGLSYDRTDGWQGINAIQFTIHQGLGILDASDHGSLLSSRIDGHSQYTKFTLGATRIQQLPSNLSVLATVTGQLATRPVLASEEIALGGANFARAYDEGEVSGDKGWAGLLELRYSPPIAAFPNGIQFYGFYDAGQVWALSDTRPQGARTLMSAGGGIRANLLTNLFATLEADKPLNRDVQTNGDRSVRVFFSITAHY